MSNCKPLIFCSLLLAALLNLLAFTELLAQEQCAKELADAEEKFQRGRLNETIALATGCLEKRDLALAESERAYKLLGKAYYAKGLLNNAKENLRKLLELIPDWRPDPEIDNPSFRKLAEEVIKEVEQEKLAQQQPIRQEQPPDSQHVVQPPPTKKGGGKKWLWLGGGSAVVAGTAAFLIFKGDEQAQRLPDPPAIPSK